jgi:hypothetical protein
MSQSQHTKVEIVDKKRNLEDVCKLFEKGFHYEIGEIS